jgi:hypothetical protein
MIGRKFNCKNSKRSNQKINKNQNNKFIIPPVQGDPKAKSLASLIITRGYAYIRTSFSPFRRLSTSFIFPFFHPFPYTHN